MLPSNMNLKIRLITVRYNNKILVSDEKFNLGKNEKVNVPPQNGAQGPVMKSHKCSKTNSLGLVHTPTITHKNQEPQTITHIGHNNEKIALVVFLASGFAIWNMFRQLIQQPPELNLTTCSKY